MDIIRIGNDIQIKATVPNLSSYDKSDIESLDCILVYCGNHYCQDQIYPYEYTIHGCGDCNYNVLPHQQRVLCYGATPFCFNHTYCFGNINRFVLPYDVDMENGTISVVYPANRQFYCGLYSYKIVLTLKEGSYGPKDLHKYTLDTGDLFVLSHCHDSKGGDVNIDVTTSQVKPKITRTITVMNGEEVWKVYKVAYKGRIPELEAPVKLGYTFVGWDIELPTRMPDEDLVINPQYEKNVVTITFKLDDGTILQSQRHANGDRMVAPNPPAREGMRFVEWRPLLPAVVPPVDMTFTAIYETLSEPDDMYVIRYYDRRGLFIESYRYAAGSLISHPFVPEEPGYTFTGWDPDITIMPAHNVDCRATYSENRYTITFDTDGGTTINPITKKYGETFIAPADPIKTGYTFVGWIPAIPETMPAYDITCVAQWEEDETQHTPVGTQNRMWRGSDTLRWNNTPKTVQQIWNIVNADALIMSNDALHTLEGTGRTWFIMFALNDNNQDVYKVTEWFDENNIDNFANVKQLILTGTDGKKYRVYWLDFSGINTHKYKVRVVKQN